METVIKELTQKVKDFKHWERLSLMRGSYPQADHYGKLAKQYEDAIKILIENKDIINENGNDNKPHHTCGLMGFNPMLGDTCPACESKR